MARSAAALQRLGAGAVAGALVSCSVAASLRMVLQASLM